MAETDHPLSSHHDTHVFRIPRPQFSAEMREEQEEMGQEECSRRSIMNVPTVLSPMKKPPRRSLERGSSSHDDTHVFRIPRPQFSAEMREEQEEMGQEEYSRRSSMNVPTVVSPMKKPPRRSLERGSSSHDDTHVYTIPRPQFSAEMREEQEEMAQEEFSRRSIMHVPTVVNPRKKPPRRSLERRQSQTYSTMTEPSDMMTEPSETMTEPSHTMTKPSDTMTEPSHTMTEPSDTMTERPVGRIIMPKRLSPKLAFADRIEQMEREGRTSVPATVEELNQGEEDGQEQPKKVLLGDDPFCKSIWVYGLHADNFTSFLDDKAASLVMFYKPSVSSCIASRDQFVKAARTNERENTAFAAVDCSVEENLCLKEQISALPTIKLYSSGQLVNTFTDKLLFSSATFSTLIKVAPEFNMEEGVTKPPCRPTQPQSWLMKTISKLRH